ncbi:MAG: polysaccharide biosynthesis C-terminal domain-containing protein [Bacteroidota bacterium]|nr:polysaccharide biosynthesis C-terminal domain-containing protein [Bacteroidota bacterium]
MNFKKELIKNIFFKGVNVLLSFVVTVLIVRLLGAQGNGIYSLFIANTAIIVLIVSFSFNSGLTYYSAKNEFSPLALINSAFVILVIQVLLILTAEKIFRAIFGFSFYVDINSAQLPSWGCLYLFAILLNGYVSAIFTGNKWFNTLNILTVITNIIFIIVFAFLLFKNHSYSIENTLLILKTYIILIALQALLNLIILLRKIKFRFRFFFLNPAQFKLVFMYAGVAFFSNLFQFFAYRMDYWFVNYFQNKDELGLYALASKLNQVLWLLPMTIAAVIIPFTVTASEELMEKIKTILRLQFNGYILLGILLAITSPILIPLIFRSDFTGTVLPFIILLPGVIIFTLTTILAAYFAGINRQDINLKISFFCFFTILIGDILLVPRFGIEGAAVASCIGYSISGFVSLYVFSKKSGWSFKELLLIKKKDFILIKNVFTDKLKTHV